MANVTPFQAVRPTSEQAAAVAALPYDVMNRKEARAMAEGRPLSFLRVSRADLEFPDEVPEDAPEVYARGRANLDRMIRDGVLRRDETPGYYLYRLTMNGREQSGIVAACDVADYLNGIILRHEYTRFDKENDRVAHFEACGMQTAPIFLTYRAVPEISSIQREVAAEKPPVLDILTDDYIRHQVWPIADPDRIRRLQTLFAGVEKLYIADGHHRTASAARVCQSFRKKYPTAGSSAPWTRFMGVIFPDQELQIFDYNRVLRDLNGHTPELLLDKLAEHFIVMKCAEGVQGRPRRKGEFGLYLDKAWYLLESDRNLFCSPDPVDRLDVSVLQNYVLEPILGIHDVRTDPRIDFVGGMRGLKELERRVADDCDVAFALYPTSLAELFDVADRNEIMPPKSTWFEPKPRSGLFAYALTDLERFDARQRSGASKFISAAVACSR